MGQGRSDQGGAGGEGGNAGYHLDLDVAPGVPAGAQQHLVSGAGHAIDADVTGGDEGHAPTGLGVLIGRHAAVDLLRHALADDLLIGQEMLNQLDVGAIANDHLGLGQGLAGAQAQVVLGARAQAHQEYLAPGGGSLGRIRQCAFIHGCDTRRWRPWRSCHRGPGI